MPVIVHLPHFNKPEGISRILKVIREVGFPEDRIYLDHNTEDTMAQARECDCYLGLTVYPYSKLTPQRVSAIVREYGADKLIVSGSADWGVSDPLSLVKVVDFLKTDGHDRGDDRQARRRHGPGVLQPHPTAGSRTSTSSPWTSARSSDRDRS